MSPISSLIQQVRQVYRTHRRFLAFVLVLLAASLPLIPNDVFRTVVVFLLGSVILQVLFELVSSLVSRKEQLIKLGHETIHYIFDITEAQRRDKLSRKFKVNDACSGSLLQQLAEAGPVASTSLICALEWVRFDADQQTRLLPLLWQYILQHRDTTDRATLVAVGAAMRKYIALMPIEQMDQLATLWESGHRASLPIELETEVAKMLYRNGQTHPPQAMNLYPQVSARLVEMVQAYTHPRILPQKSYATAALMAIQALAALRSEQAAWAVQKVAECPFRWFAKLVENALRQLRDPWSQTCPEGAAWLDSLLIAAASSR